MLKPFRALRPPRELVRKLACPPYDVVNRAEAAQYAAGNEHCFFHVSRPEIDLPPERDEHDAEVYALARKNLDAFRAKRWLVRDTEPAYYIYRQIMGAHRQTGVVGLVSVADYDSGNIRKHEHTRPDKEDDRTQHIAALGGDDESVFLTYRADARIDALIAELSAAEPEYDFVAEDGVQHILWCVPAARSAQVQASFANVNRLYIADGHHRCAAAARVARQRAGDDAAGYFLATVFPHNQVQILDYNRVVSALNGATSAQFLQQLARDFVVEPSEAKKPVRAHQFGLYLDGAWYRLAARAGSFPSDVLGSLDVSILQENVLRKLLGIADVRTDARVQFVGGIRGAEELERRVDSGEMRAAFTLFPTQLEELMAVSDANSIMPPKSTWFEPKLRSGLLLYLFER